MAKRFTDSFIYRQRHLIGFFVIAFLLYYFVCFGFARIPVGLSTAEIDSLIASSSFVFPTAIVDLPYHAFQWLSTEIFGISTFAIRWPSIILALLGSALIIGTIRNLYKSNVAMITGLIVISSVLFLGVARTGAPMTMIIFLLALAVFAFSQYLVGKEAKGLWLLLAALPLVITTYSPLGIYFLICSVVVAIFHPKIRATILRFKIYQIVLISLAAILLLAPIIVAIAFNPSIALTLLGVDNLQLSLGAIGSNLAAIIVPWDSPAGLVTPIISFTGLAIAIIGIVVLMRDRHSARSYMALGFMILALVFTVINVEFAYMFCIPIALLVAAGINSLISSWYDLFPSNPVAKLVGLVPLVILIISMVTTAHVRFINSNLYDDSVVYARNYTFEAVRATINHRSAHTINLVVTEDEMLLYGSLLRDYPSLNVTHQKSRGGGVTILIPSTFSMIEEQTPSEIVTGWTKRDNILVKVYDN